MSKATTRRNGRPGPTASRCANWISTTRFWPPSTPTPATTSLPLVAVAQHLGIGGADLIRGIATGYEIQVDLVKGICLHEHKIDHVAHLGPSVAAGLGTMLGLDKETIYQAIGQALHLTTSTRQSRKGLISSWKAYAPAWAGKVAIEAVDRAMRGEGAPAPIWEGEDGVIAWLLGGPEHTYQVPLPEPGEPKRAILDSYTKEHSAEYQSQALIDLARRMRERIGQAQRSLANREFHRALYLACGNSLLVKTLDDLRDQTALVSALSWGQAPSWQQEAGRASGHPGRGVPRCGHRGGGPAPRAHRRFRGPAFPDARLRRCRGRNRMEYR